MPTAKWWIAGVLALFVALLLFFWSDPSDSPPGKETQVEFPTRLRPDEQRRVERRHKPVASPRVAATAEPVAAPPRDALLAALAEPQGRPAFVIEVNALRNSRLGEKLVACMANKKDLNDFKREIGIDPLKDIDRLAFVGGTAYVSGFLSNLKFPGQETLQPAGPGAQMGVPPGANDTVGLWNSQLAVIGSHDEVAGAMDRAAGRAPAGGSWLPDSATYGDVYGVLPPDVLARLVPADQQAFAKRFAEVAQQISFHVDAQDDVAMTFDVGGSDTAGLSDLAKTVSAALQLATAEVSHDSNPALADLLAQARVTPNQNGGFRVEMALPQATIDQALSRCAASDGG